MPILEILTWALDKSSSFLAIIITDDVEAHQQQAGVFHGKLGQGQVGDAKQGA